MKILDTTCGMKSIWYQKNHPFVTFMDKRNGNYNTIDSNPNSNTKNKRITRIKPDIVAEWKNAPFKDNYFDMIIFDPPHLIVDRKHKKPILANRYGCLYKDTYKTTIKEGVAELFRILKPNGIFILKWCECNKKVDEILKLFPYKPMFGTKTGQSNKNHWILFIKHRFEKELEMFD